MNQHLESIKPIFVGLFGFVVQFADIDALVKIIVGLVTIGYVGAKLWLMILRNQGQLLSPWQAWKNRKNNIVKEDEE